MKDQIRRVGWARARESMQDGSTEAFRGGATAGHQLQSVEVQMRVTMIVMLLFTTTGAAAQVQPDGHFRASTLGDSAFRSERYATTDQRSRLLPAEPDESSDGWKWGLGIGAVLGGTAGAFAGHFAENFMTDQEMEVGEGTVIGSVVGLAAGALIGAGIGWLVDH